jgi:hypothetical protein
MPDNNERKFVAGALVGALFFVLATKDGAAGSFMNLMFIVVGYYFANGKGPPDGQV